MPSTRYVSRSAGHLIGALREDGRTLAFDIGVDTGLQPGTLVRGRVERMLPSLNACFLGVGDWGSVFLRGSELPAGTPPYPDRVFEQAAESAERLAPLQERLKVGSELILQVKVSARGTKAARVTGALSIPGRHLVYLPRGSGCRISRKIEERDRDRMQAWYANRPAADGGWILRTLASRSEPHQWEREAEQLKSHWHTRAKALVSAAGPTCLALHEDPVDPWILALPAAPEGRLVADGAEIYQRLASRIEMLVPEMSSTLEQFRGDDLFAAEGLDREFDRALKQTVWLPSGGALRIDTHAALTAIDIDTAGTSGTADARRTTDLEAVREIPGQLRLRGVGGMVVVDLIELESTEHRREVEAILREGLAGDKVKTRLAMLEEPWLAVIVRERSGSSLLERWTTICSRCSGSGRTR